MKQTITRKKAIKRIRQIKDFAMNHQYYEIEKVTTENGGEDAIYDFVVGPMFFNLDDSTDKILEDVINKPFFRFSMNNTLSIRG